jgi:HTH-type transcriptional regulator/antitoxin HigA
MDISPIKNQRDYRKVLKEIDGLMSAKRNTPEGDRLDALVTLVDPTTALGGHAASQRRNSN